MIENFAIALVVIAFAGTLFLFAYLGFVTGYRLSKQHRWEHWLARFATALGVVPGLLYLAGMERLHDMLFTSVLCAVWLLSNLVGSYVKQHSQESDV